ncbi:MAG TPA: AEC family transporter [Anaeromyxobacteraceae bacterium]|nr:AEC family transporter [Anaeromyxobacteraceae bacterium]
MGHLSAFARIVPVALVILLGHGLRRWGLLAEATVAELKRLIVRVTLPCLLFVAFSKVQAQATYLGLVGAMFGACALAFAAGRALARPLRFHERTFPTLQAGFEAGMMGYALFAAVYGQDQLHKIALVDLGQALFVYALMMPALERLGSGRTSGAARFLAALKNPIILAMLAGLLVQPLGLGRALAWPFVSGLLEAMALVGGLTGPLVMIVVGHELRLDLGRVRRPALAIATRLALWVPLGLVLVCVVARRWLGLDRGFEAALATVIILPPPFVIPIFLPASDREELRFVMDALAVATLATVALFGLVTVVYRGT